MQWEKKWFSSVGGVYLSKRVKCRYGSSNLTRVAVLERLTDQFTDIMVLTYGRDDIGRDRDIH